MTVTDDDLSDLLPPGTRDLVSRPLDPDRSRAMLRDASPGAQVSIAWSILLAAIRALVRCCTSSASARRSITALTRSEHARGQPSDSATQTLASESVHAVLDWALHAHEGAELCAAPS